MASTELTTSEDFHRFKRTSLLFASALIVLAFVSPTDADGSLASTPIPFVGDVDIARPVVVWLLWLGMLYYLAGFVLEARVVARDNSEAMSALSIARIDDLSARLHDATEAARSGLDQTATVLTGQTAPALVALADRANTLLPPQLPNLGPMDTISSGVFVRPGVESEVHRAMQNYLEDVRRLERDMSSRLLEARNHANTALKALEPISPQIAALQLNYRALRRELAFERHLTFWGWQIGGVATTALAATICGPLALYFPVVRSGLEALTRFVTP